MPTHTCKSEQVDAPLRTRGFFRDKGISNKIQKVKLIFDGNILG